MGKKLKHITFADILKQNEGQLKTLTDETTLPHIFDLYWDAKTVSDLKVFKLTNNPQVLQLLA